MDKSTEEDEKALTSICQEIGKLIDKYGTNAKVAICLAVYAGMGYGALDMDQQEMIACVTEAYKVGKKNRGF